MIDAKKINPKKISAAYGKRSKFYSKTVARFEKKHHMKAIKMADIDKGDKILEVAVGPGIVFTELAKKVGNQKIYGVDLSPKMMELTEKNLKHANISNYELKEADARSLPFDDNTFDLVYNGYMLDLIPTDELQSVVNEFKRVLKPNGKLVLVNMSKKTDRTTLYDILYKLLPSKIALYMLGACRPVLMEKYVANVFQSVHREYMGNRTEIVIAQ